LNAWGASEATERVSSGGCAPDQVELADRRRGLRLRWPDGVEADLGAAMLRSACRCATCTHGRRTGAPAPVDPGIELDQVVEFGVAGLQLVFSDGHRRGIFPWEYLRELARRAA
jgi:DUF971 family protein